MPDSQYKWSCFLLFLLLLLLLLLLIIIIIIIIIIRFQSLNSILISSIYKNNINEVCTITH